MTSFEYYLKEWIIPIAIAIILVIVFYSFLSFVLKTNFPLVVVVSRSMEHAENIDKKYYKYFENLGYNIAQINQFPIKHGFGIGDVLVIMKQEKYNVGDVIAFVPKCHQTLECLYEPACKGIPIVHRIVKINDDNTYMTKGDNNEDLIRKCFSEEKIESDWIEGKVIFVLPKIGLIRYLIYKILNI